MADRPIYSSSQPTLSRLIASKKPKTDKAFKKIRSVQNSSQLTLSHVEKKWGKVILKLFSYHYRIIDRKLFLFDKFPWYSDVCRNIIL